MDESLDHEPTLIERGMGIHLNHLINSSTRNPQFATRSMGVAETSPSVSRRDGEGAFKTSRRARPDRLEQAQARELDARPHLLGCTKRRKYQLCARGTTEAGWNTADAG
jgi:hypothetical protein